MRSEEQQHAARCWQRCREEASCFFPRASERRVLLIVGVCYTSSHNTHLLIFTSTHIIFTSSHPHIFSLSLSLPFSLSLSCPLSRSLSFFFFSFLRPPFRGKCRSQVQLHIAYIGPTWVNVKMAFACFGCTHALRRRQLLNYGKRESTDLRWKFGSLCGREIECSAGSRECPFYFEICKTLLDDPSNGWSELNATTIRSAWNILE